LPHGTGLTFGREHLGGDVFTLEAFPVQFHLSALLNSPLASFILLFTVFLYWDFHFWVDLKNRKTIPFITTYLIVYFC